MSEVVALLLDDAMPPDRLGALLRAARKRRGMKRKEAAAAAGTTAALLRRYERGDETVPADVCARLAECYGDDLTAHVPLRVPVQIDSGDLAVGDVRQPVGTDLDDVIAGYIDIVQRLRNTGPGDPLSLRTVDIIALAGALGRDRETIEQRIAEVLGCTPAEARHLHGELLRRKVILPVAGLAAGMAAFAGVAYAAHSPSPTTRIQTQTDRGDRVDDVDDVDHRRQAEGNGQADHARHRDPDDRARATKPPAPAHVQHVTPTTDAPKVDATVPTTTPPATLVPQPDPNDPPVSILPGETPISVIGTPDSTSDSS